MVSLYDIGCFLGAMSIVILSDRYGRERSISIASVVFILGAIIQSAAYVSRTTDPSLPQSLAQKIC